MERYFSINASFLVMETDFLASTNHFLYFFQRLLPGKAFFFLSSGNVFLNVFFTWNSLSTSGNRHCYEWKSIFKDRTYSCWWKLIFWLVETIFFHCLIYFSRSPSSQLAETHFSVQKNSIVFYSELSFLLVKTII